jgi:anaerobic selenocysteine-containing dehydrogenase
MKLLSPAGLHKPLKRIGPRGSGELEEIEWEEALAIATKRLARIRTITDEFVAITFARSEIANRP